MDWSSIFDERYPQPPATEEELGTFVGTLREPLSARELEEIRKSAAVNPFPPSDPLYGTYKPIDPTQWRLPEAELPTSYLDFLRYSNGGEFRSGRRWFQFFPALNEQFGVRAMLLAYEIPEYMPQALPFAFNGGGTFYLFDLRNGMTNGEYPIVVSHAGSLGWEQDNHRNIATTFVEACRDGWAID
ncbi:MAG: SMI1/KNR4 family protein [Chloroflexaceae bacterium]|jgi:hypothetical protein|nr:SMI1/KNR4 family protein [Chloroflexaceae bacterium]